MIDFPTIIGILGWVVYISIIIALPTLVAYLIKKRKK